MDVTVITVAVEGDADVPVVERICELAGFRVGIVYGRSGKSRLDSQLHGYNLAARYAPWLVLRDLNGDAPCAGGLVAELLPSPAPMMLFRVAVRAVEAWLLADGEALSRFLRVSKKVIPPNPDELPNPKLALVNLARRASNRAVRRDMVPQEGTTGSVGPAYISRLAEFTKKFWRPEIALEGSPSLRRCVDALQAWPLPQPRE
jgi:hypothetical protein